MIAAFSASRLVSSATSSITSTIAPISTARPARFRITDSAVSVASRIASMPAIVSRTLIRPLSARSTTRCERRTASAAEVSTSRSEVAISSIDADVSSAAFASASVFSDTCFTERTICSIELETSSTFDESRLAVSFSSSPVAPSSRIELLDSSMLSFSA